MRFAKDMFDKLIASGPILRRNHPLILVVEDDPDHMLLLSNNLKKSGYQIAQAMVSAEALEVFKQSAPDLVLLDAKMPVMDGFETCQRIMEMPGGDQTPIIFMTALEDDASVERAFSVGATDYVVKPIRWPILYARIRNLLKHRFAELRFQALAESATDGIIHDISGRKRANEVFRESENRYRDLVENSRDLICTHDLSGKILSINPWAAKSLGYTPEQLIGTHLGAGLAPEVHHLFDDYLETIRGQGEASGTAVFMTADGEKIIWEFHNTLRTEGVPEPIVRGMAHDITERVHAEREIKKSQARYQHIFETAGVSLWVEDFSKIKAAIEELKLKGVTDFPAYLDARPEFVSHMAQTIQILDVNENTLRMLNAESKEHLIGSLTTVFVPETLDILRDEIIAIANGETYFQGETINQTLDGELINILMTIVFPKEEEHFDEILISAMDITQRVQLEHESQQQTLELASLNEQLQVLNITLEERVRQRTYEMQVLHELSQEISYTLEYEELFRRMLSHLHRIVNYDVAVCLLVLDEHPIMYERISRPLLPIIQDDIQTKLTSTFERMHESQKVDWDAITIHELELLAAHQTEAINAANSPVEGLNSTFQVPLIERSKKQMIGLLFIGAEKEAAFSEESVRMLYTLATQASILLERLRSLMDVEQQRLESLVERIPEGVVLLDKSRKVILENPVGQRFLAKLTNVGRGQVLSDLGGQEIDTLLLPRQDGIPHEISLSAPEHQVFEVEGRMIESGPEAGGWALAIRDVTWERDLLAAEQTRRRELDALYNLSRELTATDDYDDVLQTISRHTVESIHVTFSRILLRVNEHGFRCQAAYPIREFDNNLGIGEFDPESTWPIYQSVLSAQEPLLLNASDGDYPPEVLGSLCYQVAQFLCLVPLKIGDVSLGVLVLGESRDNQREPFNENKIRLASSIGDQASSAIHRAELHRKTEQNLRRLTALRQIDMAITSSVDLNMTLSILLEHITTQLGVDAANVLIFNPYLQNLEYARGSGFRTKGIENLSIRLGEGYAGSAVLKQELLHVPDMMEELPDAGLATAIAGEDFIAYYGVPLIAKGEIKGVLEIYHRSLLHRDKEWLDYLETLAGQTAIAVDSAEMFAGLQRSNMELMMAYDATIEGWARALEYRDMETEGHSRRVVDLTIKIARKMGIRQEEMLYIRRGALLHDIGKMGIPDSILNKKGPLNDEEWELMRQHPVYAYEMLEKIDFLRTALDIPYYHHERWDGTGYPQGFSETQIPLPARIFAIVDVWDALSSDRPYRDAWPREKIIAHIQEQSGKHFDPQVVEVFVKLIQGEG